MGMARSAIVVPTPSEHGGKLPPDQIEQFVLVAHRSGQDAVEDGGAAVAAAVALATSIDVGACRC